MSAFVLPPSGDRVDLTVLPWQSVAIAAKDEHCAWVDSGTSALALCLKHIKQSTQAPEGAEVIVPGYCCPDIVAAAHFCQLKPVAVDLAPNSTDYDLNKLQESLSPQAIAIISPNFMGIPSDLTAIHQVLPADSPIRLIEDNAQWFPARPQDNVTSADYRIFSFGRGKPVSLLGGGVAISRHDLKAIAPENRGLVSTVLTRSKIQLYNTLSQPKYYRWLARNPYLKLGATEYHPLEAIRPMDSFQASLLAANLARYQQRTLDAQTHLLSALKQYNQLDCLKDRTSDEVRLLRYPLLVRSPKERDRICDMLMERGLGSSRLYQTAITEVPGVTGIETRCSLDNAASFSQRFLTLPTHDKVTEAHAKAISDVILSETH